VEWERTWIQERTISEGKQGCFAKTFSWFNDEGVQLAVREWCAGAGDSKFHCYINCYIYVLTYFQKLQHMVWQRQLENISIPLVQQL
jgi:hypothetical protein